jgi:molybdopterin synthase catalytic subunit
MSIVSANEDFIDITSQRLSERQVIDFISSPLAGAISLFIGTTRDNFEGRRVLELEYECYYSMAIKQFDNICKEVHQKWSINKMAIIHRTG